jgi:uncharacterized membrane protein
MDSDVITKTIGSGTGAFLSWGLQDVSVIASIVSSCVAIILGVLGIIKFAKNWNK